MSNVVKEKLKNGQVALGTWMQLPCGDVSEIIARVGFDFCVADLEHSEIGYIDLADIFRGLKDKCVGGARVQTNELMSIRRPLDLGAKIIIVPLVNNEAEAKQVVSRSKYPAEGERGFAFCRANNWGADFDEYVRIANDDLLLFTMVESKEAVEHIDEILSVDGIDGVLIGPYDLSGSFGLVGQTGCAQVKQAIEKVVKACKTHGKIAGQHIVYPTKENVKTAIEQGYTFLPLGIDALYLLNGMQEIVKSV